MPSFRERLSSIVGPRKFLAIILAGILLFALIVGFVLFLISPLGGIHLQAQGTLVQSNLRSASNASGITQATATAIAHQQTDGYDPSAKGGQIITDGSYSLKWPIGGCAYWANVRYHQLTGYWVAWNGNADQWVAGARAAGWKVSTAPHVPSIIVLMPYVQGASSYGGVAVVENMASGQNPATVYVSIMNWPGNGGGWDIVSYTNFNRGAGVFFIWHS